MDKANSVANSVGWPDLNCSAFEARLAGTCAPGPSSRPMFSPLAKNGSASSALWKRHILESPHSSYFLLGNSVTRHYAFMLAAVLNDVLAEQHDHQHHNASMSEHDGPQHVEVVDRLVEKAACSRTEMSRKDAMSLGTSSCVLPLRNRRAVHFMWKFSLGEEASREDWGRDACLANFTNRTDPLHKPNDGLIKRLHAAGELPNTERCLAHLFAHATPRDVLIVGSALTNTSAYIERLKAVNASLRGMSRVFSPALAAASELSDAPAVLGLLLRTFPGRIVYHSWPHLRMQYDGGRAPFDLNPCHRFMDERVSCAAAAHPRLLFVDLRPLQEQHAHLYQSRDFIHHAGALSELIVKAMLGALAGGCAADACPAAAAPRTV